MSCRATSLLLGSDCEGDLRVLQEGKGARQMMKRILRRWIGEVRCGFLNGREDDAWRGEAAFSV